MKTKLTLEYAINKMKGRVRSEKEQKQARVL